MKKQGTANRMSLIIAILLMLVMLSSTLVGNLLARFTTTAAGSDSGRVAKFNITETGVMQIDVTDVKFKPGTIFSQPIKVYNNSEVSVSYNLTASTTGNLPLIFRVDGEEGNPLAFSRSLDASDTEGESYTLEIYWPEEQNDEKYMRMVDVIRLSLAVVQND